MPPQTQPLIYENPSTGERVQWNGSAWAPVTKNTEAASVAARPDANSQAQSVINRTIPKEEAYRADPRLRNVNLPQGVKPEDVVSKENAYMKESGRFAAEGAGGALGGALGGAVGEGLPKLITMATRAAGTGFGAGTGSLAAGADLKDAAKTAGVFGATELGMHAAFSGGEALYKLLSDPKMSMQQAGQMLAQTLSKEDLSPRQFGKSVQEGFDAISRKAGQEKGEFIQRIASEHPDMTVNPRNLQKVLESRVQALETMKARNPDLFAQGEGLDKTLRILRSELDSTNGEMAGIRSGIRKGNLEASDLRRSQFWNYKQQLDPSMASRIVGELDKATTQDITEALVGKDKKLAEEYLTKSARYHELQNIGRTETLEKVFGDARVAPDKVAQIFVQAPEESLAAIRVLNKENPVAIQNLRRQLFEQGIKTTGVNSVFKQQPALLREIYGPQADAVKQFIEVINKKAYTDALVQAVPGVKGTLIRVATGSGKGVSISTREMTKILKSSEMLRLFTQAAEMPANSGPAKLMRETLDRAIKAVEMEPGEAAPSTRKAIWKGGEEPPAGATPAPGGGTPPAPMSSGAAKYGGPERRIGGDLPSGTAERRTGAADRQLSVLKDRLKGASEEEKKIINAQIESIRANPEDPEYVDRRGRAPGEKGPRADPKTMKEAVEKQRQRLKEFEEEYARIMQEQGGK